MLTGSGFKGVGSDAEGLYTKIKSLTERKWSDPRRARSCSIQVHTFEEMSVKTHTCCH